jgi:hypothetical protein
MMPALYHMYEKENLKCRSVWTVFAHCMWYEVWLPFSGTAHTAIVHMPLLSLEPRPGEYGKYKDVPEYSYPVEGLSLLVFHPCIIDILIKWKCRICVCMLLPHNKLLYRWSFQKIKTNELLQKLTASWLAKKLILHGTQTLNSVFIRAHHWPLP